MRVTSHPQDLVRRMIFIVREQRTVESSRIRIKRLISYAITLFYNFELIYIHDGLDSYSELDRTFESKEKSYRDI